MAIQAQNLKDATRTFEIEFEGETADITYRLGAFGHAYWAQYGKADIYTLLALLLVSWGVVDDAGDMIGVDEASLRAADLPTPFLRAVHVAILQDAQPDRLSSARSGGGSRSQTPATNRRNGTAGSGNSKPRRRG